MKSTINQKTKLELINPWSTILDSFIIIIIRIAIVVALVLLYGLLFSMRMRKNEENNNQTAQPELFSHVKNWFLCLVLRNKQKQFCSFFDELATKSMKG